MALFAAGACVAVALIAAPVQAAGPAVVPLVVPPAGVAAVPVIVITDVVGRQSADVAAALTARGHRVRVQSVDGVPGASGASGVNNGSGNVVTEARATGAVVLAVGKKSAQQVNALPIERRAALMVSESDAPLALPAVVVDVPFATELPWIATALPGRLRLVVGRNPRRKDAVDAPLTAAAAAAGFALVIVDVAAPGEAVPALEAALARPGGKAVLLLIADDAVVTADTIAPLMQAAFRARVPVVGFSAYFGKVGAIAVVTADPARMAVEAVALALAPPCPPSTSTSAPTTPTTPTTTPTTAKPLTGCAARHVVSASTHLLVDGRLAERLGIPVQAGAQVEVRR